MHEMKLLPLPLPPFYKEPTYGVLQSMLSHTVWFTMEYKWNQNKLKRSSQKKERGYHIALTSCSIFWLGPFLSWAFLPLPYRQFSHTRSTLRRKAFPNSASAGQGSGQFSQNARASRWGVGDRQGKCSTLKKGEFLAQERYSLKGWDRAFHRILGTSPFKMDYFSVRHKMEVLIIYHSAYWAIVTEIEI